MDLILFFFLISISFGVRGEDYEYSDEPQDQYDQLKLSTIVFNAFPFTNTSAFVLFEEDRINRLQYGEHAITKTKLDQYADFIIQFKSMGKEGKINDIVCSV